MCLIYQKLALVSPPQTTEAMKSASTTNVTSAEGTSPDASSKEHTVDESEVDEIPTDIKDYLYHPFDLHTPLRKRTQIQLLHFLIYEIKVNVLLF